MITYVVEDDHGQQHRYGLSYQDLQEEHRRFCAVSDTEFLANLPAAAHLACFISWVKENGQWACSDVGIVHEIIHVMHIGPENTRSLQSIREQFKRELELV